MCLVNVNPVLSSIQKNEVQTLLTEFSDVISDSPGCTTTLVHEMKLVFGTSSTETLPCAN